MASSSFQLYLKIFIIIVISLLLLIPTVMIMSIINERERTKAEAISEMSSNWGREQVLFGPILNVPYKKMMVDKDEKGKETISYAEGIYYVLPTKLNVQGNLDTEARRRGIFEAVVYGSDLTFQGSFDEMLELTAQKEKDENLLLDKAFITVGISDLKGLENLVTLQWNGKSIPFNAGIKNSGLLQSGIHSNLNLAADSLATRQTFEIKLNLKGSQKIHFSPIGKETKVALQSKWNTPKFSGEFLPDERNVTDAGFTATWEILHLNRNFPQLWKNDAYNIVNNAIFGVDLILPIDNYQKAMRTAKYAIMFIAFTFITFFLIEVMNRKRLHPVQYVLVGLALCLFYTLLLSISEQSSFNFAYWIATAMIIGLIGIYTRTILRSTPIALLISGILFILYGFIFIIIQLSDYSLLVGSIGLFIILAVVMYVTRKIDWYNLGVEGENLR